MATSKRSGSPLFGWLEAGSDMMAAQLSQVTDTVNKRIDETHALFEELQARGEVMDKQIKTQLSPSHMFSSFQELVMANPVFSLFSSDNRHNKREQQIDVLSAKVDLLIEQVALLAAKQAAEKKAEEKPAAKPKRTSARRKTSTATKTSAKTSSSAGAASKSTPKRTTRSGSSAAKKSSPAKSSGANSAAKSTKEE
ncbi:hypothetical protein [Alteromonas sp. H39]|uniref:hypothetical protein n=1 Tax=Alteromonas sp. H39 TaxID=3389876 RepID=UPI0039E146CE